MDDIPSPIRLEEDAIYLGVLTARSVKPLSRLEYPVEPYILDALEHMGLTIVPVTRIARDGTLVSHWVLGKDSNLIDQYRAEFDGKVLQGETPPVIRSESQYFGYPACCAEAYARDPLSLNSPTVVEQALLFHRACPECKETPTLLPLYKSALVEARRLYQRLGCRLSSRPRGDRANVLGLVFRARREEKARVAEFGEQWDANCRRVPAWVPHLWRRVE